MALWAKWQFMDRSVTHKIVYGPQLRFGPYNILWVTSRSINCHMALSAMKYLLNIGCERFCFRRLFTIDWFQPEIVTGQYKSRAGISNVTFPGGRGK
jgi:hypothetical protein